MATTVDIATSLSGTASWSCVIWEHWNSNTITTCTTDPWYHWVSGTSTSSSSATDTLEALEERRERLRVAKVREEEEFKARRAAEKRAEELLLEHLAKEQRKEFLRYRHFVVHGARHRYRIREGRSANVDVVGRDGRILHRLCIHPEERVPDHDTMLAQKLMLEHDEAAFARIANRHPNYGGSEPVLPALH